MDTNIYHPVNPATVTEEAGTRGGTHMGRDYAAARGQAVYTPITGTVIYAGGDGASGTLPGTNIAANGQALVVRIRRQDGFIAHVAHMDFMSVRVGQAVVGGQTIRCRRHRMVYRRACPRRVPVGSVLERRQLD